MAKNTCTFMENLLNPDINFNQRCDCQKIITLKLYITRDFGKTWVLLQMFVKSFEWYSETSSTDKDLIIQRMEPNGDSVILKLMSFLTDRTGNRIVGVMLPGVNDMIVKGQYMFATKNITGSNATTLPSRDLYVKCGSSYFMKATFDTEIPRIEFHIVDITENRLSVAVAHSNTLCNFYVSNVISNETEKIKFSLSLERIFCFFPNITWKDSLIHALSETTLIDIHKVEGTRGIYIASQVDQILGNSSAITMEHFTTKMTFNWGISWRELNLTHTLNGAPCKSDNCSLHLTQKFALWYPSRMTPILSSKSAPGLIIATGIVGQNMKGHPSVYMSRDAGVTWKQVNEQLLMNCLKNSHPDSRIIIQNYDDGQNNIVEFGTNYTSEIIRASVEYECDGKSLQEFFVIKVPQLNPHYEFMSQFGFYDKETYIYNSVLWKMAEMLDAPPIPKHYFTTESGALVLQDLTMQNYRLMKKASLNLELSTQVLHEVAKFHAASARLNELDSNILVEASHETMCTQGMLSSTMSASYPVLLEALRGEDVDPEVMQNFAKFERLINEGEICQIVNRRCWFNVLNHGDLKTNNMLFKCDNQPGSAPPVIFVDYQTCRWNSPVLDLIFFYMVTMDFATYEKNHEQLQRSYLTTLNETLSRLGSKCIYTKEDYNADMAGCKQFLVYMLIWIGFLDIRESVANFELFQVVTLPEMDIKRIRESQTFKNRFLNWFRHYEKLLFLK